MRVALLLALLLAACAPEQVVREEQTTIVSLNPCADAILTQLAAPEQLLAISHYSHDPRATSMPLDNARQFASTGGTAEEIIALAPDMVVADIFLPPATKTALQRAGIKVMQTGMITSRADSDTLIDEMAALTGNGHDGDALKADIAASWNAAKWQGAPATALLWQEGGIVPGDDTLAAAMLKQTGFTLHSAAKGMGQGAYLPLEAVLADPPQVILASGGERMLTHPALRELDAVAYARFDSSLLYCGGPTIIRAVERLAQIREGLS